MKATRLAAPLLLTLGLSAGCAADESEPDSQEGNIRAGSIVTTYNGDLGLLGSYNELFDNGNDTPCVKYEDGGDHARVSEPTRDLSIEHIKQKEDLAQKLGIDLNMKARFATVSGNAALNLLHEYSSASNSVTYLLSGSVDYLVRDKVAEGRSVVLTDAGRAALDQGPAEFYRTCGTHYVDAVRYGARFYLLITYKATNHASKVQMDASLGIDGAVTGSGDVKSRLERTASLDGVSVTVKAASNGFWLDREPAAAVIKAMQSADVDQNLFGAATELYFEMTKAVENEYCLDSGQGTCEGGVESPGYFARNSRDASVTGVQLGDYHTLVNANTTGEENPFQVIKERVETTRRFIRNWSELEVRMDNIYADEIRPFLESSQKDKAMFNIAPPGKPLRTPDEVYAVAKELDEMIYPPTAGVMGWYREDIHDRIVGCMDKVNVDIMASCTEDDVTVDGTDLGRELEADETKEWAELYAFFEDYHNTKRILPLHVSSASYEVTYDDAEDQCERLAGELNETLSAQGSTNKVVYRLAQGAEVYALAPVLGYGNIAWNDSDIEHATWFTPGNGLGECGNDFPYFQNEPASEASSFGCSTNDWWDDDLIAICVPASGPTPIMAPQ